MNVFLDFDDTITDSIENVVRIANKRYNRNNNHEDLERWDFFDMYPDIPRDEIMEIFGEQEFFDTLRIKPDALMVIYKLSKRNNFTVVSKVSEEALKRKAVWIRKNFNDIGIPLEFKGVPLGKSKGIIDMTGGVIVDDNVKFLEETNAKYKIYFNNGRKFDETQHWDGLTVHNWKELDTVLRDILHKEKGIANGKI